MGENKKGQNMLYLVLGVATLVVAIIGATFAYFSAQASSGANDIQGGTYDDLSTALSLEVERVTFEEVYEDGETYHNLVPAIIDTDEDGLATTASIGKAIENKCVSGGYTGCHLYKITASSTQTLEKVSIRLAKLTTDATDKASWSYTIYKSDDGQEETVSSVVATSNFSKLATDYPYSETEASGFDMHNASLTGTEDEGEPVYYYLMVYLANKDNVQNPGEQDTTNAEHDGTGTYSGLITMDAAGGKVVASFSTTA